MLQTSKSPAVLQSNNLGSMAAPEPAEAGLADLVNFASGFIRRQYLVVSVCLILSLALGFLYLRVTPPTYKAQATMVIDTRKGQFFQQQSIFAEAPNDSAQVESQLQILRSD